MAMLDEIFDPAALPPIPGNFGVAVQLAEAGLPVFPCSADKRPLPGIRWRDQSTTDLETLAEIWRDDALPGVDVGKAGLVVIDVDRHGGPDGFHALEQERAANELPSGPRTATQSGGAHLFFRQPSGTPLGNRPGRFKGRGVDVRGNGGYVIGPGATLPDGRRWKTADGSPDLCEAFEAGAIPILPEWLLAAVRGDNDNRAPIAAERWGAAPAASRCAQYARKAFVEEVEAVRNASSGGRNQQLNESTFKLARLVAPDGLTAGEIEAAMLDAATACGLVEDKGGSAARSTIASGLRAGMATPRDVAAELAARDMASVAFFPPAISLEEDGLEDEAVDETASDELPAHLTRPAGLLSEMMDWITASAQRPNPVLSLGAAITTLGTVIGRRVAGPTQSGTHLYAAMLAPSAAGKDHPQRCAADMLRAACPTANLVGPGEFASQPAFSIHMENSPLSLCCFDEFGAFLSRICARMASPWERGLTKSFRELWGAPFKTVQPMAYAGRPSAPIRWPAISLLGASTHGEFYDALGSKDATNGFLNRFLLLSSTSKIEFGDPDDDSGEIPHSITGRLAELYDQCGGAEAPLGRSLSDPSLLDPSGKIRIAWESDAVRAEFRDLQRLASEKGERAVISELYGRTAEMAVRLATIHAVSREGLRATVTVEDLAWGRDLSLWSSDMMAREASMRIADTAAQAIAQHILRTIRENRKPITHRDLCRKLQNKYKSAELKDAIASLVESGTMEETVTVPKHGGPKTHRYRIARQP